MGNIFEGIAETVSKIVSWVDTPCRPCAVVGVLQDAICGEIPHVWVGIVDDVLLHSKERFFWFILPIFHGPEFAEGFFDGTVTMNTLEARVFLAILASTAFVYLLSCY